MDSLDELFEALREHVRQALMQMPVDDTGHICVSSADIGVMILASAFGLATSLGVRREDLQQVVHRCMPAEETPRIIQ